MYLDSLPKFSQLTPDDRVWRIDWLGDIAYPGSVRRYAQPSVKVVLSAICCDPSDTNTLVSPDSSDYQHQHETWAPIAALPMLAIGDLWQQGQRIASPDYQVESFRRLAITQETTAFIKAGLAIDGHFLLPLGQHPWHRRNTQSYCVAIDMDNQRRLLVPCMEIIRFYFGSSSNFLQRLFTGPLTTERLWKSKRFNPTNRHLHLVLADRISSVSAPDIGRIAENRLAWRSAAGVHASCLKASTDCQPVYPYTGFPFEGQTDMVASGMWLPFGVQENATFLAFQLRSCSHPFPFQSLSFVPGDWNVKYPSWQGGRGSDDKRYAQYRSREQKSEVSESDPGNNRAQRKTSVISHNRFPDLRRKHIWHDDIEAVAARSVDVYLRREDGQLEQLAAGESQWSSEITGIDISRASSGDIAAARPPSPPWFVRSGLKDIEANQSCRSENLQIKIVCPKGRKTPVFNMPTIVDGDGVIENRLLFSSDDGSARLRRGCFVEITDENARTKLLLILEGRNRLVRPDILPVENTEVTHAVEIVCSQ